MYGNVTVDIKYYKTQGSQHFMETKFPDEFSKLHDPVNIAPLFLDSLV